MQLDNQPARPGGAPTPPDPTYFQGKTSLNEQSIPKHEKVGLQDLGKTLIAHVETRIQLFKVEAFGKIAEVASGVASVVAASFLAFITLIMGSMALGFAIAQLFDPHNLAAGFGIVTLLYAILAFFFWKNKEKIIGEPVENTIIKQLFADPEDLENDENLPKKADN